MSEDTDRIDAATGTETTGHVWDGIRELNTPLPRWWLWIFYATIVWAIGYMILYPAVPLVDRALPGLLGYSSRQKVEQEIARVAQSRADLDARIAKLSLAEIRADRTLWEYAQRGGASIFKLACVQCHGSGAAGSEELGYPNLNDDAWLWGGTLEEIYQTISHGIRNDADADAHASLMPAFGADRILSRDEIGAVADYVLSLSGRENDAEAAARGAQIFADNCAVCHGADAKGQQALGAPDLTDPIWLYGGTREAIVSQVTNPRHGAMPPWANWFDEAARKKLAIYVHSLGGGR